MSVMALTGSSALLLSCPKTLSTPKTITVPVTTNIRPRIVQLRKRTAEVDEVVDSYTSF